MAKMLLVGSERSSPSEVIEVRTYRAQPGQRERVMGLMREMAFPVHREFGMRVLGPLPSTEDWVTVVWRPAFCRGSEWAGGLAAQLMPMIEEYGALVVEDHEGLWDQWPTEST